MQHSLTWQRVSELWPLYPVTFQFPGASWMDTCATCLTDKTGVINHLDFCNMLDSAMLSNNTTLCMSVWVSSIKAMLCPVQMVRSAATVILYFKLYLSINPFLVSTKLVSTRKASKQQLGQCWLAGGCISVYLFAFSGEPWEKPVILENC